MKLIEPTVELLVQEPGLEGMYKMIDRVAGICYGRTKLHKDSKAFVDELIKKGHMRPLEFGTVYLVLDDVSEEVEFYKKNQYSMVLELQTDKYNSVYYVTTNYRVIVENERYSDLEYWCKDWSFMYRRPCFLFTCLRGVADEFRTHVSLSSMMQSTRYCDSSNLKVIVPQWYKDKPEQVIPWQSAMDMCEKYYNNMLQRGASKQEARGVLPLDMATQLCMCGFVDIENTGWNRFLEMRCDKTAHPEAQFLANKVKELIYK